MSNKKICQSLALNQEWFTLVRKKEKGLKLDPVVTFNWTRGGRDAEAAIMSCILKMRTAALFTLLPTCMELTQCDKTHQKKNTPHPTARTTPIIHTNTLEARTCADADPERAL